jgi:hypothetical protein
MAENWKNNYSKKVIILLNILKLIVIAIICVAAGAIIYFAFYSQSTCEDIGCYNDALLNCKKVSFIRTGEDSVWQYDILNVRDDSSCNVQVRLLKRTDGEIIFENLQDQSMICMVYNTEDSFPEEDMSRCHGKLKEGFQEIIIDRMHNYLLQNIGEISAEFQGV